MHVFTAPTSEPDPLLLFFIQIVLVVGFRLPVQVSRASMGLTSQPKINSNMVLDSVRYQSVVDCMVRQLKASAKVFRVLKCSQHGTEGCVIYPARHLNYASRISCFIKEVLSI